MKLVVGVALLLSSPAVMAQQVQTDCRNDGYGNVRCITKQSPYSNDFSLQHWQQPPQQSPEEVGQGIADMQSAWRDYYERKKLKKERKRLEQERKRLEALQANPFADLIPEQP